MKHGRSRCSRWDNINGSGYLVSMLARRVDYEAACSADVLLEEAVFAVKSN
jgi:hypothetical protein